MTISKWTVYFFVLLLLRSPFVIYTAIWLSDSQRTVAVVFDVKETTLVRPRQTYPIFQYTSSNFLITSPGNYNLPYAVGDSVPIRYYPSDPTNFLLDTTWDCWKDLLYYFSLPLIFSTMVFLAKDTLPRKIRLW